MFCTPFNFCHFPHFELLSANPVLQGLSIADSPPLTPIQSHSDCALDQRLSAHSSCGLQRTGSGVGQRPTSPLTAPSFIALRCSKCLRKTSISCYLTNQLPPHHPRTSRELNFRGRGSLHSCAQIFQHRVAAFDLLFVARRAGEMRTCLILRNRPLLVFDVARQTRGPTVVICARNSPGGETP